MSTVIRTTELEAVNYMLLSIGESPVSSLTGTSTADVSIAKEIINRVSTDVQAQGWSWNTDLNYKIIQDSNGYIPLPTDAMMADTVCNSQTKNLIERNYNGSQYLYDVENHTFDIGEAVYVDLVRIFTFESLPEVARQYIMIRSARKFQDKMIGSETSFKMLKQDEMEALANLKNAEGENADHNILSGHTQFAQALLRY